MTIKGSLSPSSDLYCSVYLGHLIGYHAADLRATAVELYAYLTRLSWLITTDDFANQFWSEADIPARDPDFYQQMLNAENNVRKQVKQQVLRLSVGELNRSIRDALHQIMLYFQRRAQFSIYSALEVQGLVEKLMGKIPQHINLAGDVRGFAQFIAMA